MIATIQSANLGVRFLLEVCALAALAYWGAHIGGGALVKAAAAIGAPLLAALLWGMVVAPNAAVRLPAPLPFVLGLVILGVAAASLASARHPGLAGAFAAIVVTNAALMYAWKQ